MEAPTGEQASELPHYIIYRVGKPEAAFDPD